MSGSESDEDDLIHYGTALEPYDEDEIPSKKMRDQSEQHALDAHGRRRFHGAFTGGFSAGFGNTVGTPEGWAPATFKSSRGEKAKFTSQRPEDFMDEEDRSEFGIAPRRIQMQNEFTGQKRAYQQKKFHDGPIPGEPVLEQLLRPVHETTVVKMLKDMGWKPGQGIGERLTLKEKKSAKEKHKVYGCYLPPEIRQANFESTAEESDSDIEEFDYDALFAPEDYEPYILQRKDNRFGLGYTGLSRHSILGNLVGEYSSDPSSSSSHLLMSEKGKKVSIRGQAFGVGALEEDDEDIYAKEDMSHYDFTLGGPKPSKDKQRDVKHKNSNVLEGFVRAKKPLPVPPSYPPPALPRGYTPSPAGKRKSRFEPDHTHEERDQGLGRHELSAEARGSLLGEKPIERINTEPDEQTKEQEETPTQTDDRMSKLLGRNVNFISADADDKSKENPDFIPINKTKNDNVRIFKPFVSDPMKQARYEKFLVDKDEAVSLERDGTIDRLSEWERNRELVEFEQAEKLYKPLTGVMGERFTHASQPDDGALNPLCAVAKSVGDRGGATPEQVDAAAKGLYGALTRTSREWRPDGLVCKRFNVPDPFETRPENKKEEKSKINYSIFDYLETSVHDKESFTKEQSKFSGSKSLLRDVLPKPKGANRADPIQVEGETNLIHKEKGNESHLIQKDNETPSEYQEKDGKLHDIVNKRMTVAELFLQEAERDQAKALESDEQTANMTDTIEKFDRMELYKAIFLSDSEDEAIEKDKSKETNCSDFVETPKNVERNPSPPRGIFANIDFDELNSWNKTGPSVDKEKKENKTEPKDRNAENQYDSMKNAVDEENMYGPKIPEKLKEKIETSNIVHDADFKPSFRTRSERDLDSRSSSDSWVEAEEVKHKKKKKHKKHKSKHKSKHKKKEK